jgi:hypothetical protein
MNRRAAEARFRCNFTAIKLISAPPKSWIDEKVAPVKRTACSKNALMDDAYYVSAAAVADKIIERMRRGLDPLLFRRSMLALIPAADSFNTRLQRKPD